MKNIKLIVLSIALTPVAVFAQSEATNQNSNTNEPVKKGYYEERKQEMKMELKEARDTVKREIGEAKGEMQIMKSERMEDRKELRGETKEMMKSASSSEERQRILKDANTKREQIKTEYKDKRKEIKLEVKSAVKEKVNAVHNRLKEVNQNMNNVLVKASLIIANKKASSADVTKAEALLLNSKTLQEKAVADVKAVEALVLAVDTTGANKDEIRAQSKLASESIKALHLAVKELITEIKNLK